MDDTIRDEIKELPDDWWQNLSTCGTFSKHFINHMLGLLISGNIYGTEQTVIFTGFLFLYEKTLFWFTAGHVVDKINNILSITTDNNLQVRWLDETATRSKTESIPINFKDIKFFSGTQYDFDFGTTILSQLEAELILKGNSIPLRFSELSSNQDPEGYYVVGYPSNFIKVDQRQIGKNTIRKELTAVLLCIPIKKVPYPGGDPSKEFFNDPGAFYGNIVDYPDDPEFKPNVKNMSGGPILSIERDPNGQIKYQLCGIQRSWDEKLRMIRAEPIQKVVEMFKYANENEEK
jgi:hypothetical protein